MRLVESAGSDALDKIGNDDAQVDREQSDLMYLHTPTHTPQHYLEQSDNGAFGAAVEHLDLSVGRFIDLLEESGLTNDTIVIVTSDNGSTAEGGASNAPLRGRKFETWEGGVRVPCIVSWPAKKGKGRIGGITSAMDLLPTLTTACSLPKTRPDIDGRDLTELLFSDKDEPSPHDIFYYYNADALEAVRWRYWKLRIISGELFDLDTDVAETRDVSNKHPDIMRNIRQIAETARALLGDELEGRKGSATRPPGRVKDPVTLTEYVDQDIVDAMYDWLEGPFASIVISSPAPPSHQRSS
jgi:arylsulfatase A-like enzyme